MLRRALGIALLGALATAAPAAARTKPVAALSGPATVRVGVKATFDASSSRVDPSGEIVEYAWDLDADGTFEEIRRGSRITIVPEVLGEQVLSVRITDDAGATSTAVGHYLVEGEPVVPVTPEVPETPVAPESPGSAPAVLGGSPELGIAPLDGIARRWLTVGSRSRFAAVNGAVRRRIGAVRRGLWVNLLSDRPARFALAVRLRGARRPVRVVRASTRLAVAGQRPLRIRLPRAVRRALRPGLTLLVRGTATGADGERAPVSRAFVLRL